MSSSYRLASTAVIHECLEGEVIAANLDTGVYYSMQGLAAILWQCLLQNGDSASCVAICKKQYPDASTLEGDLSRFFDALCQEQLLCQEVTASPSLALTETWVWPERYAAPALHKYEEMTQLLKLDPIHEVDEQGWPKQNTLELMD